MFQRLPYGIAFVCAVLKLHLCSLCFFAVADFGIYNDALERRGDRSTLMCPTSFSLEHLQDRMIM